MLSLLPVLEFAHYSLLVMSEDHATCTNATRIESPSCDTQQAILVHHDTMTSNPNWDEITLALLPGRTPNHLPDLMARVFHLKLRALLHDLHKRHVFGKTTAGTFVVEYQKRGLPHAHILIRLEVAARPITGKDINSMVTAELPDQAQQPLLWETVTSSMLDGPCGIINPQCPCMVNGRCKSRYPRPFVPETTCSEDGYPLY